MSSRSGSVRPTAHMQCHRRLIYKPFRTTQWGVSRIGSTKRHAGVSSDWGQSAETGSERTRNSVHMACAEPPYARYVGNDEYRAPVTPFGGLVTDHPLGRLVSLEAAP